LITENYPHLLLITETWFTNNSITNLDNYTLFSKHRSYSSGGGVAIYTRDDILTVEANHIIKPASLSERTSLDILNSIKVASELVRKKKFTGLLITVIPTILT